MRAKKLAHEMSAHELEAHLVRVTGVRTPPAGSPREDLNGWFVAVVFAIAARDFAPGEAETWAATELLRCRDFAVFRPHAEMALGRPFTSTEIATRTVEHPGVVRQLT